MLWGGRRAPFTLIGGYLGAGKTTVLNELIRSAAGRRWAVLVNDVGAVNVDAALVESHDGDTLALTNGCVCCSIADDLGMTLESIRSWPEPPEHVIMELSGVAEPARVAPWASTAGFRLDGIVVVVDAERIVGQLADGVVGDAVGAQIDAADLLLVAKVDLVDDRGVAAARLLADRSQAPVLSALSGRVSAELLLGIETPSVPEPRAEMPAPHQVTVECLSAITVDELRAVVEALGDDVVRAKGLITCAGDDAPIEVNVVGRRRVVRRRPDLHAPDNGNQLVVIRLPRRHGV